MKAKKHTTSLFLALLLPVAVGCAGGTEAADDPAALLAGATQGEVAPSGSSVDSPNSVGLDAQNVAEMSDEEIVATVLTHLKSILANLESLDTTELPEKIQARVPKAIEKLTAKIASIEGSEELQGKIVEKVRNRGFKPFPGGYEGKRPKWLGGKGGRGKGLLGKLKNGGSVGDLCTTLQSFLDSGKIQSEQVRERIATKYEEECQSAE